jgi:predicted ATP-grasp superfamily ATP-dependent carboligase
VVPVPRTRVPAGAEDLRAAAEAIGFPAIVKPLLRCLVDSEDLSQPPFEKTFGAKAVRVRTPRELADAYDRARHAGFTVLVQEEIEGPVSALRSLGLYATRGGAVAAAFTSEKLDQVPADFGDGLVVRAVAAPELIALGQRVVDHFGFYGMADVEFKWDSRQAAYRLLDINPRPWLWMNLPTACGVNLAYAAFLDALDRPVPPALFHQRDFATRWVSARGRLVHLIRAARGGRLRAALGSCRHHIRGRRVGPLFDARDPLLSMFCSPRFWWDSVQQAGRGFRQLRALGDEGRYQRPLSHEERLRS